MKVFHCDHCHSLVFYENTQCVTCQHLLAFLPRLMIVGSLDPSAASTDLWTSPLPAAGERPFRLCVNYRETQVCNWAIDADDENPLCVSCRLTRTIPDLNAENHRAWYRLEVAKRRLLYTLLELGLPLGGVGTTQPLAFEFLADSPAGAGPVLTGHSNGLVTINIAEADDAERERRRTALREPYRTLLGHFRHEVGHYYWSVLIEPSPDRLARFRELFGDDTADYSASLQRHYQEGAPTDWQERFISAYASAHAWEDWAETWAHYLHIADTLEIAAACGVSLRPRRHDEPTMPCLPADVVTERRTFDGLLERWFALTHLLNNLNRGLGLPDAYPFVLSDAVTGKLRFIHETIGDSRTRGG